MSDAAQLGNRIYYCERCGLRIPPADFQNQRAQIVNETEAICAVCSQRGDAMVSAPVSTPSAGSQPVIHAAAHHDTAQSGKTARRNTAAHTRGNSHGAPATPLPWKSALAGAVVFGVLLGAFALSRSKKPDATAELKPAVENKRESVPTKVAEKKPEPPRVAPAPVAVVNPPRETPPSPQPAEPKVAVRPAPPTPPVDDYDPRKAVADSMLAQAKEFQKKNPEDVFGYRDKLQFLIERYRSTAAGEEATKLIAEIKLPAFDPDLHPEFTAETEWAKSVSLLGSVDPKKDALAGNWSLNNGNVRSDKSMWSKLGLPYTLPEEYDLRLTFTRHDNDCLLIVLARRGKPFIFSIGSGNAHVSFEDVREKRKDVVPTKMSRGGLFSNGARQQVVVQVRRACLRGYLNGKLMVGCQVDDDGLSLNPQLQMPQPNQIGLMTWDSVYDFHTLEILPLKGEGKMLR